MTLLTLAAAGAGVLVHDRWLLRGIDLEIHAGEVVALAGPNGAGKSTLLKALAGDLALTEGEIRLGGRPLTELRPRDLALKRAVLPQQTVVEFAFTAREIVEMGRAARRRADNHASVVTRVMAQTDALPFETRIFPSLSGGEQSRVSLARVLAQETPILLLDEPTANLDLRHQELVMALARQVARNGGIVVVIAHDLNLAAAHADRVAMLANGKLVAIGTPWETLQEPLLKQVFECSVSVTRHPLRDCPLVLALPDAGDD
jgi:iron complex transport system ATP-binding protein